MRSVGLGGFLQSLIDAIEAMVARRRFGPLLLGMVLAAATTAGGVAALVIVLIVLVQFGR